MSDFLTKIIDWLYRPFSRFIPCETFRYAAVGGINLGFGVVLYWGLFNFVLQKQDTDFGIVTVSAPILAFLINFVITFFSGFWLTRSVAFSSSVIHRGKQIFRYAQVVAVNVAVNYFGLKLLIEVFEFYPTPSYMSLQIVTVAISYIASKYYTFRS